MCTPLVPCGRDDSLANRYLHLTSRLLSVAFCNRTNICCRGANSVILEALHRSPGWKAGFHYLFNLIPMQFERRLLKPNFNVTERIDMLAMLRTLLIRLSGLLDERCVQSTQYFREVCTGNDVLLFPWGKKILNDFLCNVGFGRWKVRIDYCVPCFATDDNLLVADCCIYQ